MAELTPKMVNQLACEYPAKYDKIYFKYIEQGRHGNIFALKAITKWKNPSYSGKPMDFKNHKKKNDAWEYFIGRLKSYLKQGKEKLRNDFKNRAPVWAMFWHHVLYDTPIFDVNTHIAFRFFNDGKKMTKEEAKITPGRHWKLYDEYCRWFNNQLTRLHNSDPSIDARTLDRALFMWSKKNR